MQDMCHMRALVTCQTMIGAFSPGNTFWCTPQWAKHFIENKIAVPIDTDIGPKETQVVTGPTETKKSLPEEQAGHSTASQELPAPGKDAPPSASQEATPSQRNRSLMSRLARPKRT